MPDNTDGRAVMIDIADQIIESQTSLRGSQARLLAEQVIDQLIQVDPSEGEHIVVVDGDGFYVVHPLTERFEIDLGECKVFKWLVGNLDWDAPEEQGRYRTVISDDGAITDLMRIGD